MVVHYIDVFKDSLKSAIWQLMTICARKNDFTALVL